MSKCSMRYQYALVELLVYVLAQAYALDGSEDVLTECAMAMLKRSSLTAYIHRLAYQTVLVSTIMRTCACHMIHLILLCAGNEACPPCLHSTSCFQESSISILHFTRMHARTGIWIAKKISNAYIV